MAFLQQVFTVPSMVSGASLTSSVELPGSYVYMYVVVPSMTSGFAADTKIFVQGSGDNTTFYRYALPEVNTAGVVTNDFAIQSAACQKVVFVPNFALRYVRLETTALATAGIATQNPFKIICVSNQ